MCWKAPAFIAPEMLSQGEEPLTPRTDVYLLGGILHEALTGRVRHEGFNLLEVLHHAWTSAPYDYHASVPRELAALCNRATHRDPSQRPGDAKAFADALVTFGEHQASEHLVDAALARLDVLRALTPGSDPATAQRLWAEANFGFHQATEAWRENPRAAAGRRETTIWMVGHELASRNVDAAEALLLTLQSAPEELTAEVTRLRGESEREASEVASLRDLAREMDTRVSAWERSRAAAVVVVATAGALLVVAALRSRGVIALTHGSLAVVLAAVSALAAAATWRWRKVFLANRVGRELIAMPFVALAGALASLWVGAQLGLSAGASAVMGMLAAATVFGAMAVTIDRRLFVVSATVLGATLAGAALPARALDVVTLAALCASVEVALLFRAIAK